MGAVNTTYTFSPTDTITSAKMNNIIDQTTMTSSAVSGSTLQVTPSGQLIVNSQGITSNELAAQAVTQAKVATNVVGNGPCVDGYVYADNRILSFNEFSAIRISIASAKNWPNMYTNNRFTANVAGWYFLSLRLTKIASTYYTTWAPAIRVNGGTPFVGVGFDQSRDVATPDLIKVVYLNGSTDYVEFGVYALIGSASSYTFGAEVSGFLISSP